MRTRACFLAAAVAAGCAGPNPTQTRVSLLTYYSPRVTVYVCRGGNTNAPAAQADARRSETMTVAPEMRGVAVLLDNQLSFPNGSGNASSNAVLSGIEMKSR